MSIDHDIVTFTNQKARILEGNARLPLLMPETFEKGRRVAPGWDVYYLEQEWREWITGKKKLKNSDAAFIAFCRQKY